MWDNVGQGGSAFERHQRDQPKTRPIQASTRLRRRNSGIVTAPPRISSPSPSNALLNCKTRCANTVSPTSLLKTSGAGNAVLKRVMARMAERRFCRWSGVSGLGMAAFPGHRAWMATLLEFKPEDAQSNKAAGASVNPWIQPAIGELPSGKRHSTLISRQTSQAVETSHLADFHQVTCGTCQLDVKFLCAVLKKNGLRPKAQSGEATGKKSAEAEIAVAMDAEEEFRLANGGNQLRVESEHLERDVV